MGIVSFSNQIWVASRLEMYYNRGNPVDTPILTLFFKMDNHFFVFLPDIFPQEGRP
jgi:hypothetical protein